MTYLDVTLQAWALRDGRAQRRRSVRHTHIEPEPLVILPWQPGGEPFTIHAMAWGTGATPSGSTVVGQPLNRDLLFAALEDFANWFVPRFSHPWNRRTTGNHIVATPPQVLVSGPAAVRSLARLGRRLAYLPTVALADGPPPAAELVVRLGRHLLWLANHAASPGQNLLINAQSLASDAWATPQTIVERQDLAALDAWIEPGTNGGYRSAADAESTAVGPVPLPAMERDLMHIRETFNAARRAGDAAGLLRATRELAAFWDPRTQAAWDLVRRVVDRERAHPAEARFLPERWRHDAQAYVDHMSWLEGPAKGRRRVRASTRQAIRIRVEEENAKTRYTTETTVSDDLALIPLLMDGKAVEGAVVSYDSSKRAVKPGNKKLSAAPLLTLRTSLPCIIPRSKSLWWTEEPGKVEAHIIGLEPDPAGSGDLVHLQIERNIAVAGRLATASSACFSVLSTDTFDWIRLPSDPFTHAAADAESQHIEEEGS